MLLTHILCTFIAFARYSRSSSVHDSSCDTATENIALVQRQASVRISQKELGYDFTNETSDSGEETKAKCTGCKFGTKGDCISNIKQCVNSHNGLCPAGLKLCKPKPTPKPTPSACQAPHGPVATCAAWGDPHYFASFHKGGKKFDHMGLGVFQLASAQDGCFEVQAFQCPLRQAAVYAGFAIKDDDRVVQIIGKQVYINGVKFDGESFDFAAAGNPAEGFCMSSTSCSDGVTALFNTEYRKVKKVHKNVDYAMAMTLKVDTTMVDASGICGKSPAGASKVSCDASLFTSEQIAELQDFCGMPECKEPDDYKPPTSPEEACEDTGTDFGEAQELCKEKPSDFVDACLLDYCNSGGDDSFIDQTPDTPPPTITPSPNIPPTPEPTASPTKSPTSSPTKSPTESPTTSPTDRPTKSPTASPTASPTESPTATPTGSPTASPTNSPTTPPTDRPTESPTDSPTSSPTKSPTTSPTESPTETPTEPTKPEVIGDPHVTNIRGEKFNVYKVGQMTFLRVPYQSTFNDANLTIMGHVQDIVGTNDKCEQGLYITSLLFGGAWVGDQKLKVSVEDGELAARVGPSFARVNPSDLGTSIGNLLHLRVLDKEQLQLRAGPKMSIGVSAAGDHAGKHFFLNLDAKSVAALNSRIGGLLGEDSHDDVSTRPLGCLPKLTKKHPDFISYATAA